MFLKRYLLMKDLKSLLLDGRETSAFHVADEIASDILDSEEPNVRLQNPKMHQEIIFNSAPKIIAEAKRQLRLTDWNSDAEDDAGAA